MIEYRNVSKEYQGKRGTVAAVKDVSLLVEAGEFCVLLGPSGCGKTTLLRMTNRLVDPTSGTILIDGRNIHDEDPVALRLRIGYVIQGVGLFPHRTVARNIGTTLELLGADRKAIDHRVDALLELVRLDPSAYRDRYPSELSGGEAQRIGVARTLAADPPLLLMDEPFGAIDPINRAGLQREFLSLQRELNKTIILVTHDVSEACLFADRVALMREGRLIGYESPAELLRDPTDDFVRDFFGSEVEFLLLDSFTARDILEDPSGAGMNAASEGISPATSLKKALGIMMATGERTLHVVEGGRVVGVIRLDALLDRMQFATSESHVRDGDG